MRSIHPRNPRQVGRTATVGRDNRGRRPRRRRPCATPFESRRAVQMSPLPSTGVPQGSSSSAGRSHPRSALPGVHLLGSWPCRTTATPACAAVRPRRGGWRWSSSMPLRRLDRHRNPTVARMAERADRLEQVTLPRQGAPQPLRVTLGTGQPKFGWSTWSARSSSTTIRTASPTTYGSTPYNWSDLGDSSGAKVIMSHRSARSARARGHTGAASRTEAAPESRRALTAARATVPVSTPSSTKITSRPATASSGAIATP